MRELLLRGMLAGVVASILAIGFASVFGEPALERAIAFEEATAGADAHGATPSEAGAHAGTSEPVGRGVQRTAGLGVGLVGLGVAFGGIFSVAFALARGRLGAISDRATAVTVATILFIAMYLVPFLKYPANPPAVGLAETAQARTAAYLVMLLLSALIVTGAVLLQRRLAAARGEWDAWMIAAAAGCAALAVVAVAMPSFTELPDAFPADTLWRFRVASVGTQLVLWLGIGVAFGTLTERAARARR